MNEEETIELSAETIVQLSEAIVEHLRRRGYRLVLDTEATHLL